MRRTWRRGTGKPAPSESDMYGSHQRGGTAPAVKPSIERDGTPATTSRRALTRAGPERAFVPLLAGILKMSSSHFYLANVLSVLVWHQCTCFLASWSAWLLCLEGRTHRSSASTPWA